VCAHYCSDERGIPIDANSTLLRGCVLRNVEFVHAVVVYTGNETKVRVKQQTTSNKKAAVEKQINAYIIALLILQVALCIFGAIAATVWANAHSANLFYLDGTEDVNSAQGVQLFFIL
jgi:magnesium-transporting ATPase (P-type)